MYQWCGFKSRRGKNKNLTALKSNFNTVWFNIQMYIIFSINLVSLVTLRFSGTDILYGCHLLIDVCIIYFSYWFRNDQVFKQQLKKCKSTVLLYIYEWMWSSGPGRRTQGQANGAAVHQWCGFKSRRGKNKKLTVLKPNSNTAWFNFQTYILFSINLVSFVTLRSSGTDILYGCHLLLDVYIYIYTSEN